LRYAKYFTYIIQNFSRNAVPWLVNTAFILCYITAIKIFSSRRLRISLTT